MSRQSLNSLFQPKSIAVIGATNNRYRIGHQVVRSLLLGGFNGPIYPINPKLKTLLQLPAFPSIEAVTEDIDLAIIVLRKDRVLEAADACGRKGVNAIIVMSSAFSESGDQTTEDELQKCVQKYGMRLLGPNCAGFAATTERIYASFENRLQPGQLAFISQSGSMCAVILALAQAVGLGFSMFVSYGNATDIGPDEVLSYLGGHAPTKLIGCYLEGIKHAREFLSVAQTITPSKPVVVLKPGETQAATQAIQSHTGALGGVQALYAGAFRQAGILQALTLDEFIDGCLILSNQIPPEGNRVGIITNSGGPGVLAVDACSRSNLAVTPFPQTLVQEFSSFLPPFCLMVNPVDLGPEGSPATYQRVTEILLKHPDIDMVLVLCVPTAFSDIKAISEGIAQAKMSNPKKPLVTSWLTEDIVKAGLPTLTKAGIPNFATPQRAATALRFLHQRAEWLRSR
ncbi:MAG: acetate--CoA ligase family protein [Promethearchaeota archaeon]